MGACAAGVVRMPLPCLAAACLPRRPMPALLSPAWCARCAFCSTAHRHTTAAAAAAAEVAESAATPASWAGLPAWRAAPPDRRTLWADRRPVEPTGEQTGEPTGARQQQAIESALAGCARQVLTTAGADAKAALTHAVWRAYCAGGMPVGAAEPPARPARPPKPELVPHNHVPAAGTGPLPLNAAVLHNLAHIELNAIDLAWDTVARFSGLGLPAGFYEDFARVADDEARHLQWCLQRLRELGWDYGDMPAHSLLWTGAEASAGDLRSRLAVVPMSQEARGLDAGERLADRLVGWGDTTSAAIVARIAAEERAHVAVGVVWFRAVCDALGSDPGASFRSLLLEAAPDLAKGPFHHEARREVGLPREWYDVAAWPEEQAAAVHTVLAAKKAAYRAAKAAAAGGSASQGAAPPSPAVGHGAEAAAPRLAALSRDDLALLRQRLAGMLATEAAAAGA